jgi:hypothetical protein
MNAKNNKKSFNSLNLNDKEICKQCIYYDDFCCRNSNAICVNNSEYENVKEVINAINQKGEIVKNE